MAGKRVTLGRRIRSERPSFIWSKAASSGHLWAEIRDLLCVDDSQLPHSRNLGSPSLIIITGKMLLSQFR